MDWYSLDTLSDDAQAELDLLSATFPELGFDESVNSAVLSVPARDGSDGAARAVAADLSLHLPAGYPSEACVVTVVRSRGGVDDTALQKKLQTVADEEAKDGVPCLYQLIEDARDVMGQAVSADRDCEICLDGVKAADIFVAPECLHVFHQACFARWVHAFDLRQAAATSNVQAREHAHSVIHAAEEDLRAATAQHDAALLTQAAANAEAAAVQALVTAARAGPQEAAACLREQAGLTSSAAASGVGGEVSTAASWFIPCIRVCVEQADAVAGSKLRRGEAAPPSLGSQPPLQQLEVAADMLLSAPQLLKGLLSTAKTRLASSKAKQKTADRTAERAAARHATATSTLADTVEAQAGKGERAKDTPCPVCRAQVAYSQVEGWVGPLLQGMEGGSAAQGSGNSHTASVPFESLDATTAAYIHTVQQRVVRGLKRQLGTGGVLQEAVAEAEAVLADLEAVMAAKLQR